MHTSVHERTLRFGCWFSVFLPLPLPAMEVGATLTALTAGSSPPSTIKAAETSLLEAEDADPDLLCLCLLGAALCPGPSGLLGEGPRLAALLALRAAVGRRWSDRGRGSGRVSGRVSGSVSGRGRRLLSARTRDAVRRSVLSAVVGEDVGGAAGEGWGWEAEAEANLVATHLCRGHFRARRRRRRRRPSSSSGATSIDGALAVEVELRAQGPRRAVAVDLTRVHDLRRIGFRHAVRIEKRDNEIGRAHV